jgi:hypothetical protein
MITLIVVLVALAVVTGFVFAIGAGPLAVVPLIALVAVAVWLVWALLGGRPPAEATRKVHKAELLGPGGPDDPDAPRG